MHIVIKHIVSNIGIGLFLIFSVDFLLLDPIYSQFFILLIISLLSFVVQSNWVFVIQDEKKPIN